MLSDLLFYDVILPSWSSSSLHDTQPSGLTLASHTLTQVFKGAHNESVLAEILKADTLLEELSDVSHHLQHTQSTKRGHSHVGHAWWEEKQSKGAELCFSKLERNL